CALPISCFTGSRYMLRRICFAALMVAFSFLANAGYSQTTAPVLSAADVKTPWTSELQPEWLQQVMPAADSFSDKEGSPPVFRAFSHDASGEQTLIGYVFLSADVPPEEKGYSKPIAIDRKSTRLNSSHVKISYAVFCLKK